MKYEILKKQFGYDSFRPGQEEIIDSIMAGNDTLAIMPTGAGKSLCYQIPALMLPGITLVVSPLISLMKDQVRTLNENGIRAAYLNSSLTYEQYRKALYLASKNEYRIIYVAPERLESESFLRFVEHADISMLAIDEAHCVSQWGQNFRPSYLHIRQFRETYLKDSRFCAFTATATPAVESDMISLLGMHDVHTVKTGYDRKNLFFSVEYPASPQFRLADLIRSRKDESGIIYCPTRKSVEEVHETLVSFGIAAARYHAGLSDEERAKSQEDFIYDRVQVIVATNAFGMGIDKPDVRFVIHYGMPSSLENYYQEAGRAGRDGGPAECILFYHARDYDLQNFLIEHTDYQTEDKALIAQRKEKDRKRLDAMRGYALCQNCLRQYILNYFHEAAPAHCDACSNCAHEYETIDVADYAHTILAVMKTAKERFGKMVIVSLCTGKKNDMIAKYGLDKSSLFGALDNVPEDLLLDVLRYMISAGLIREEGERYRILKITPKGNAYFRHPEELSMRRYKKERTREQDGETVAGLRALRTKLSRKFRVPPYEIFSDRTMRQLAAQQPETKAELLQISGIGEVRYKKYGRYILSFFKERH